MKLRSGYVLGTETGRGATGSVFHAHDANGREVAAKLLRNAERFEAEASVLEALDHPRIVRVLDWVEDPAGSFLIMEWVDGINLAELLQRDGTPGLPADRVLGWMLQAADGLAYVHDQQTVHRDVKPQNLMLSPERGVIVVDFGIARGEAAFGTREIGTPGYMAPESYEGGSITARSDVYGLAATAWTLIGGRPPRLGAAEELPGATPHLTAALREALAIDPRERTPSMAAFAANLGGRVHREDGRDMAVAVEDRPLLQGVVRTMAGVFDAAATTLAIVRGNGEIVFVAAWGASAESLVGRTLPAGTGILGRSIARRAPELIADVRNDPDWARGFASTTGYQPMSMMVVPMIADNGRLIGALMILDRRDGRPYQMDDFGRAQLFADLALAAVTADAEARPQTGTTFAAPTREAL